MSQITELLARRTSPGYVPPTGKGWAARRQIKRLRTAIVRVTRVPRSSVTDLRITSRTSNPWGMSGTQVTTTAKLSIDGEPFLATVMVMSETPSPFNQHHDLEQRLEATLTHCATMMTWNYRHNGYEPAYDADTSFASFMLGVS